MKLSFLLKCEVFFCHFMDCRLIGSCLWMKHSDGLIIVFLHNFVHTNKKCFQLHIFDKLGKNKIKEALSNKINKGCTIHI